MTNSRHQQQERHLAASSEKITEPGLWLQYDFGDGPVVDGAKTVLLYAWLAWCRHRVVIPLRDRTAPSVYAGLDRIFRQVGGVPTYLLTDNEKMVTTEHIASVAVRNPGVVSFARHYPLTEQRHAFAQVDGLGRDRSVMSGL